MTDDSKSDAVAEIFRSVYSKLDERAPDPPDWGRVSSLTQRRPVRPQAVGLAVALGTAVGILVLVAGVAFLLRPSESGPTVVGETTATTSSDDTPPTTQLPAVTPLFEESPDVVLLFDDGIDGVLALDPLDQAGTRNVIAGQRAGDQPYRLHMANRHLVVGWGEIYASSLDTGESVFLGDATMFVPAAESDRVWLVDYPGGRIGEGTPEVSEVEIATGATIRGPISVDVDGHPAIGVRGGLAFETDDGVAIWDADSGQVVQRFGTGTGFVSDSSGHIPTRLAWCEDQCTELHVTNVETGEDLAVTHPDGSAFDGRSARFSNDRRFIAAPAGADVVVVDLETEESRVGFTVPGQTAPSLYAEWDPFGPFLFASTYGYQEPAMTLVYHRALDDHTQFADLPFGGALGFVVINDPLVKSRMIQPDDQSPADCPAPRGFPSGRSEPCGFRF